ncbi:MAG: hypothetical protein PHN94_00780 [Bacteroidales bacterium]|nr:hypothetical protein [Bacteroidales bacterium]
MVNLPDPLLFCNCLANKIFLHTTGQEDGLGNILAGKIQIITAAWRAEEMEIPLEPVS